MSKEFDMKIGYNVKPPWVCPAPPPTPLDLTGRRGKRQHSQTFQEDGKQNTHLNVA